MCDTQVEEYYILYFDVMGYRSKILSMQEDIFLKSILDLMYRANEKNWNYLKIVSFSDNVLVAIKSDIVDALKKICHYASRIQELMLRNQQLLLRGAITKGNLFIRGNFVFGRGLVKVVELEETKAIFPRIIIDESLTSESYIVDSKNTIKTDKDGTKYINFLNYYHPSINRNGERKKNFLDLNNSFALLMDELSKQIGESGDTLKVSLSQKKSWLIDYQKNIYADYKLYQWLDFS